MAAVKPKKKRERGRPTKFDAAVVAAICSDVEKGVPFNYACDAAGIGERTGYDWRDRGSKGEAPYDQFFAAITRARAICVKEHVVKAADGKTGAQWLLERRFSKDFGSKQVLEHSGPDGKPIQIDRPLRELSEAELQQIINADAR